VGPRLELRQVEVTALQADTWRVRLIVQNSGWLPSYVSANGLARKQTRGVLAEIHLPQEAQLLSGKPRTSLGELKGWAHLNTGVSFWSNREPTADRAFAEWTVRSPAGAAVELVAWHERAGRISARAILGD
jgi:hypothetical protein